MNVKAGRDPALGTAPVGKLFWKLALPAIAAQLVNVLCNIAVSYTHLTLPTKVLV